jgi:hypothetical protein
LRKSDQAQRTQKVRGIGRRILCLKQSCQISSEN